jgi:hypothetical protein
MKTKKQKRNNTTKKGGMLKDKIIKAFNTWRTFNSTLLLLPLQCHHVNPEGDKFTLYDVNNNSIGIYDGNITVTNVNRVIPKKAVDILSQ